VLSNSRHSLLCDQVTSPHGWSNTLRLLSRQLLATMDGGHNGSVEDLLEELTCHRVMLTSLEDEPHDGVEEERKEIQESIARLERAVEEARQGASRTETILPDAVEHDGERLEQGTGARARTLTKRLPAPFPPRRPAGDNGMYGKKPLSAIVPLSCFTVYPRYPSEATSQPLCL
jgi:hypothetical protein